MIEYDGEVYVTVSEIARQLKVSRGTCYNNLLPQVQRYYLPGRKHALYRQSDLTPLTTIRREEHRSVSPASPTTDQAGEESTNRPNSHHSSLATWQTQYSLPGRPTQPVHA